MPTQRLLKILRSLTIAMLTSVRVFMFSLIYSDSSAWNAESNNKIQTAIRGPKVEMKFENIVKGTSSAPFSYVILTFL